MDMETKNLKFTPAYFFEEQAVSPSATISIFAVQYEFYFFGDYVISNKPNLKEARKELLDIIFNYYSTDYMHYYANYGVKNWRQFRKRFLNGFKIQKKAYFHKIIYTDSTKAQVKDYFNDFIMLGTYQGF